MFDVVFNIFFYVALVILTAVGFWMIWSAAAHLRIAVQSRGWPRAKLEIVEVSTRAKQESRLVRKNARGGDFMAGDSPQDATYATKTQTVYYPALTYAYEVEGRRYESRNVDPWNCEGSSGRTAGDVVAKQRAWGENRSVAYDPNQPSRHVLGWAHFPVFGTAVGLTLGPFLASGIVVLIRDLLGAFGLAVPTVGEGEHSIVFLGVLAFVVVALLFARAARADEPAER